MQRLRTNCKENSGRNIYTFERRSATRLHVVTKLVSFERRDNDASGLNAVHWYRGCHGADKITDLSIKGLLSAFKIRDSLASYEDG